MDNFKTVLKAQVSDVAIANENTIVLKVDTPNTIVLTLRYTGVERCTVSIAEGLNKLSLNSDLSDAISAITIVSWAMTVIYLVPGRYTLRVSGKNGLSTFYLDVVGSITTESGLINISPPIESFTYMTKLNHLRLSKVKIYGDITELAVGNPVIANVNLGGNNNSLNYGDIVDYAKSVYALNGKRGGTVNFNANQKLSINGVYLRGQRPVVITFTATGFTITEPTSFADITFTYGIDSGWSYENNQE